MSKVKKRDGSLVDFDGSKIINALSKAYAEKGKTIDVAFWEGFIERNFPAYDDEVVYEIEDIQDEVQKKLIEVEYEVGLAYILYRNQRKTDRELANEQFNFVSQYIEASNTANATVDDNSNVANKNVGVLNAEIHKRRNINSNREWERRKLRELFPNSGLDKQYGKDLLSRVFYKNDENSFPFPVPYCVAGSMYPFLLHGLELLGGKSTKPKNLDSFCGMYINLVFALSGMFAGACMYKDQKLFIRENGEIQQVTAKGLVEKMLKSSDKRFVNYQGEWQYNETESLEVFENGVFVPVNRVFKRKYSDKIYRISTKDGYTAMVSKDHIFKQMYKGREFETKAECLKVGDTVFMNKDFSGIVDSNNKDWKTGWLIGILCGDGSISGEYEVRLAVNYQQEYLGDIFNEYSQEIFGVTLNKREGNKCFDFRLSDKDFNAKIKEFIIGSSTYDKHIETKDKSIEFCLGFLDGLFCADGSYSEKRGISISLTNKELSNNIFDIVSMLGISYAGVHTLAEKENRKESYYQYVPARIIKYLVHTTKKMIQRGQSKQDSQREYYYYGHNALIKSGNDRCLWSYNGKQSYSTDVIDNISIVENDDDFVYEIETETHWYNCGGFMTHNCALPETLVCFDWYARKEWGDDYYLNEDKAITADWVSRQLTVKQQIRQYFEQIIHSINQPSGARGQQSAFVNFSIFDQYFFEGMFGNFYFPDETQPKWESVQWLQECFMEWFNAERLRTVLTFPVVSVTLLVDKETGAPKDTRMEEFVCKEWAEGDSFFVYTSDSVDSLSSCCFDGDTKVLWKSSATGVRLTTLKELHAMKSDDKNNFRIFHNGSWVEGKSIKLPNRDMFKVVTENGKEFIMTDNHINVTLDGEKNTSELTTEDYLLFNTQVANAVPENDEHLTYAEGFLVGMFLGDGSFGTRTEYGIYDTNFSLSEKKYEVAKIQLSQALKDLNIDSEIGLSEVYNNVYPVRISSKQLVAFIQKWTNWKEGTKAETKEVNLNCLLQSVEFRQGILYGWYHTDGGSSNRCYTSSKSLAESMEVLITSLGKQSRIDVSDRTEEPIVIRGKEFKRNFPIYCVRWYKDTNNRTNKDASKSWIKFNNGIYFKVKSIEQVQHEECVYCIECKNQNEPYFTLPSGLITHNCRLKNKIQTKEFNFTNGNMGVETGSKSVISLNLSRIMQNFFREVIGDTEAVVKDRISIIKERWSEYQQYIGAILERVYKYHIAYNENLYDLYDAHLLPAYEAGFIDLNKQYLTIGLNGLNQSAEFLGMRCSDNEDYQWYCENLFSTVKDMNTAHNGTFNGHKLTFNTEQVPAESLAVKNYNWDKEDGYWVPTDTNLYASYVYKPNDNKVQILEKIRLHGDRFIGDYLDGGSAAHLNLDAHLSKAQYKYLLRYSIANGCTYLTFNVPNSECQECKYITKHPIKVCPKCGSNKIDYYDRVIGYLTKVANWSEGRQIEQGLRIYEGVSKEDIGK